MMSLNRFKVARFSLLALFGIVTVLQLFSFPGQFSHMRRVNGLSLLIEILLTLVVVAKPSKVGFTPLQATFG
jgi:hypothetical protein